MTAPPRRLLLLPVLLVLAGVLAACGGAPTTGAKGYVDGEGVITQLPAAKRRAPGTVAGRSLDGKRLSLAAHRGKVVVVNVWGSWCPPCRAEADNLVAAAKQLAPRGVVFLGIDSRDPNVAQARAFVRTYHVPYPSIYDPSGQNLLAFHGTLGPTSIPSTVVIDRQGRVAASILGEVTGTQTLVDIVEQVAAGSSS
ncbi:MAG TPA: TlpA disulfide reductase family protein [Marmoricola sp.]|nr:TlpA disulfide reductase family protein [Marmoricola sp.]